MLNHIYCFISCNDFKDILDSLLERGLKQLSPGVFGLFRSSIHQMLHVITLSTKQTIFAPPCRYKGAKYTTRAIDMCVFSVINNNLNLSQVISCSILEHPIVTWK